MNELDIFCAKYEKIYIYGAGKYGRIMCLYLEDHDVNIGGFIVSGKVSYNDEVLGYKIYSIDTLSDFPKYGVIVAVNSSIAPEVSDKLKDKNFDNLYFFTDEKELSVLSDQITFSKKHINRKNINVLLWHRVGNIGIDTRKLSVDLSLFKDQLKFLKENYEIIRSDDDWKKSDKPSIILTFDDGYLDFYNVILPILNEYEIPATVFITTGSIDTDEELWGDRLEQLVFYNESNNNDFIFQGRFYEISSEENRYNTLFQLRDLLKNSSNSDRNNMLCELSDSIGINYRNRKSHRIMNSKEILECSRSPYVTIGAHTVSHCSLAFESLEVQYKEMSESKNVLENIIQRPVEVFAYPYGTPEDFNDNTIRIAIDIGFKKIFSACPGLINHNIFEDINGRFPRNSIATCKDVNSSIRKLKLLERIYADVYI